MYHPTILKLDSAASDFHDRGMQQATNGAFRLAGQLQQELLKNSPYKTGRRYLHAQWCWALGHIGLLYQLIRWFKKNSPKTELILEASAATNPHFLNALLPFITVVNRIPEDQVDEAQYNAVYFGCPDGINTLVNFYKMIERECEDIHLLELTWQEHEEADELMASLGAKKPFVAFQARATSHDPIRNVTIEQTEKDLEPFKARGYSVISTGLDQHPINARYRSVLELKDPTRASFLLSATCDQFIGSNSGAWTIPHAYRRPVIILNDYERAAWIYP